jgi:hypothetical protein
LNAEDARAEAHGTTTEQRLGDEAEACLLLRGYQPTGMAELLATVGGVAAVCVGRGWPGGCARATAVCVGGLGWFRVGSDDSEIATDAGEGIDGEFEL